MEIEIETEIEERSERPEIGRLLIETEMAIGIEIAEGSERPQTADCRIHNED